MKKQSRHETITREVWDMLAALQNGQQQQAIVHLSCVASLCGLIAMKRKLDPEICQTAGLLHDLWLYCNFPVDPMDHRRHGQYGSAMAGGILHKLDVYEQEEIELICQMISLHDNKADADGEYDEVLKDADALGQFLRKWGYDRGYAFHGRERRVLRELGIETDPASPGIRSEHAENDV